MEIKEEIRSLLDRSFSPFHVVKNVEDELVNKGFKELKENENFKLELGKNYYVKRNGTSIIAFKLPKTIEELNFRIEASHTDSPTFKLKPHPTIKSRNYVSINVEPYGGMIMSTFLDRPLSIAGRVMIEKNGNLENKLFNIDRDLLEIPNVAIHMNREINSGYHFNPAVDLIPLISTNENFDFEKMLLDELGEKDAKVSSFDLFLYNRDKSHEIGFEKEFICTILLFFHAFAQEHGRILLDRSALQLHADDLLIAHLLGRVQRIGPEAVLHIHDSAAANAFLDAQTDLHGDLLTDLEHILVGNKSRLGLLHSGHTGHLTDLLFHALFFQSFFLSDLLALGAALGVAVLGQLAVPDLHAVLHFHCTGGRAVLDAHELIDIHMDEFTGPFLIAGQQDTGEGLFDLQFPHIVPVVGLSLFGVGHGHGTGPGRNPGLTANGIQRQISGEIRFPHQQDLAAFLFRQAVAVAGILAQYSTGVFRTDLDQ